MITFDKIINNVPEQIISTINQCVQLQEIGTLEKWLNDCNKEIERRQLKRENTYSLFCEKAYLELVLAH